jgi:hypothetical protein
MFELGAPKRVSIGSPYYRSATNLCGCTSTSATTSSIDQSRLSIPAAIAGEVRSVEWPHSQKLLGGALFERRFRGADRGFLLRLETGLDQAANRIRLRVQPCSEPVVANFFPKFGIEADQLLHWISRLTWHKRNISHRALFKIDGFTIFRICSTCYGPVRW